MQRMLFARLLLQDARVIVLDEPFNAIDAKTCADLLELVRRWHAEQRTVLAALHDLDLVKAHFPEALLLAREPVAWGATADVLTPENMLKARRMCEAFDEQAEACVVARRLDRHASTTSSSRRSPNSSSCAARWSAPLRWRSARRRSACS